MKIEVEMPGLAPNSGFLEGKKNGGSSSSALNLFIL